MKHSHWHRYSIFSDKTGLLTQVLELCWWYIHTDTGTVSSLIKQAHWHRYSIFSDETGTLTQVLHLLWWNRHTDAGTVSSLIKQAHWHRYCAFLSVSDLTLRRDSLPLEISFFTADSLIDSHLLVYWLIHCYCSLTHTHLFVTQCAWGETHSFRRGPLWLGSWGDPMGLTGCWNPRTN